MVEISQANSLFIVHVQSKSKPIQVPAGLPAGWMPLPLTRDFWYIIKARQVFESGDSVNFATIDTDTLPLAFDFPLSVNKSWCPVRIDLNDTNLKPITNCDYAGKLTVLQQSAYQVPAGNFENCFQIDQASNGGDIFQWFCQNIGVVEIKFDHGGTKFGFKQVLTSYSRGSIQRIQQDSTKNVNN